MTEEYFILVSLFTTLELKQFKMRILCLISLLSVAAANQFYQEGEDRATPNLAAPFISQLQTIQKQITGIAGVLGELNQSFNRAMQTGVRGLTGRKRRDDSNAGGSSSSSSSGQPSVPSVPQVPYGQNNGSQPSVPQVPELPGNQFSNQTGGRPQVPENFQNNTNIPNVPDVPKVPENPWSNQTSQFQNGTNVPRPQIPSGQSGQNRTVPGVPGLDLGGAFLKSFGDVLNQFRAVSNTLGQISSEFNNIVASSSRLVTGRKKRQAGATGNPLDVFSSLLGQLTRQANDLSSQVTTMFGSFGNQVSSSVRGTGTSTGPLGGITDSFVGAVNQLQKSLTG